MRGYQKYAFVAPLLALFVLADQWIALSQDDRPPVSELDKQVRKTLAEGRQVFRFDTFGDESFWGDTLRLHQAIEGTRFGGVGPGVSPKTALAVGLKIDVNALPDTLVAALRNDQIDLDDPSVTLELLRNNAVVGLTGFFDGGPGLRSLGMQCAVCHSTVDNSIAAGIGHRLRSPRQPVARLKCIEHPAPGGSSGSAQSPHGLGTWQIRCGALPGR
jgi:hypothetical protein